MSDEKEKTVKREKIIVMKIVLYKRRIRFVILIGKTVIWAKEIQMQPTHSMEFLQTKSEMEKRAWGMFHED